LACDFTFKQACDYKLFPGTAKSQAVGAGNILERVFKEHEAKMLAMGYNKTSEFGLHLIHKDAVATHIASLPGEPPPAALYLCGVWSMGQVKDIYFHQMPGGCTALLCGI
jgi:hypothetical protein